MGSKFPTKCHTVHLKEDTNPATNDCVKCDPNTPSARTKNAPGKTKATAKKTTPSVGTKVQRKTKGAVEKTPRLTGVISEHVAAEILVSMSKHHQK